MTGPTWPPTAPQPYQYSAKVKQGSWPSRHPLWFGAIALLVGIGIGAAGSSSSSGAKSGTIAITSSTPTVAATAPAVAPSPAENTSAEAASILASAKAAGAAQEASADASRAAAQSAAAAAQIGFARDQGFAEMTVPHCSTDSIGIGSCDFTVENTTGQTRSGTVELTVLVGGQSQGVLDGAIDSLGAGESRTVEVEDTNPLPTGSFKTQFGVTAAFDG